MSGTNTRAVALFNRGTASAIHHRPVEPDRHSHRRGHGARPLGRTDLGTFTGSYTASSVPGHGVVMLKVTSAP